MRVRLAADLYAPRVATVEINSEVYTLRLTECVIEVATDPDGAPRVRMALSGHVSDGGDAESLPPTIEHADEASALIPAGKDPPALLCTIARLAELCQTWPQEASVEVLGDTLGVYGPNDTYLGMIDEHGPTGE